MPRNRWRSTFSERRFHGWLARSLPRRAAGLLPIGDDTAALPLGGNRVALLTTDVLTEGTHFLPDSAPDRIGAAVAAASLSDVAAKGGRPIGLLLDLLFPPDTPESWPKAVVRGAERMMGRYGAHLVGGDTKASPVRSVVGTVLALGDRRYLAPRSGARPGDVLVTTGFAGRGGYSGLALSDRPSPRERSALLDLRPRLSEGATIARVAHAMVDTSDGLAEGAHLIAEASAVRLTISAEEVPIFPPLIRTLRSRDRALPVAFFGGDYELLAAVPPSRWPGLDHATRRAGAPLTMVGSVTKGSGAFLRTTGGTRPLPRAGWDPFRPRSPGRR